MKKLEYLLNYGGVKKDVILLVISAIALVFSLIGIIDAPFNIAWVAIALCGLPIILEAIIGLVTAFDIKADVLVSIALIASVNIGEEFAAGEIAFIMQLGALLEDLTVAKARAGIEKLVRLTPQKARLIINEAERIVSVEQVKINDILRILPGEAVPVDGVILSGSTSINQAIMTGESLPVDKSAGDEVSSGTVNQFGVFEMRATKVGENSSVQQMIRLVRSADAGKAKIVGIADRWATWVVIIALTAAILTWLITGEIIRAVTILVVFCPCALVLATPTAIMAAIGNATRHGFLVRAGDALERLAKVTRVTFDKTGTLTYGTPQVVHVKCISNEFSRDALYAICTSAEQFSEHPLGKAIVRSYKRAQQTNLLFTENFQLLPGRGVSAIVEGETVFAGNLELLAEQSVSISEELKKSAGQYLTQGCTVIYISVDGNAAGYIALSDIVREESCGMIEALIKLRAAPTLLTGDHESAAKAIAKQLHIQDVHANCLPEDKLNLIESYQGKGEFICMIGDGINDAPALKKADVGIAMGVIGSDIAVDAADIVIVDDDIKELPHLMALSKRMMTTINVNMSFSMGLNFLAMILAMIGILNPVFGALVHNTGSVLVIINSALLLKWKYGIS